MDKLPNYRTDFRSIKDDVSPQEWRLRVDLAACYRLMDVYGMTDLTYNHITVRVPGPEHHVLINLYGLLYKEITASSFARIDLDGNVVWKPDTDYYVNKAGYVIHGAIHKARHDVACVIHTHTWAGMALSALECGVLPITQTAMRFLRIGYHDYQGVVLDKAEEESLLRDLGEGEALILRNHGLLTVGKTIGEAFNWMHRLELTARSQLAAMATGARLVRVPQNVLQETYLNYQPQTRRPYGVMEWPALLRMMDRLDPSFRE